VFFFDRVSRGTIELAQAARAAGALVVFEPSGRSDAKLFAEALGIAHVIKYSTDRLRGLDGPVTTESPWLEIRTMGSAGLQFRDLRDGRSSDWVVLPAVSASSVVDSCGAGDWCTAGFIVGLGRHGAAGLASASVESIADALAYGQQLAAWNCGFEGARGGMYAPARWPERLSAAHARDAMTEDVDETSDANGVMCPSCSPV
jgi:fructokinase